jgi:hypothetical protein
MGEIIPTQRYIRRMSGPWMQVCYPDLLRPKYILDLAKKANSSPAAAGASFNTFFLRLNSLILLVVYFSYLTFYPLISIFLFVFLSKKKKKTKQTDNQQKRTFLLMQLFFELD